MTPWRWAVLCFLIVSFFFRWGRLALAVHSARQQPHGKRTARPIFWVMTSAYLLFFISGMREALAQPTPRSWGIALLGLFTFLSALMLRERIMRELGRYFSPDIEIRSGHRVVREGFYGWVRHPLLACLWLEITGLALALNAPWTLVIVGGGVYAPIILMRQRLEEKALIGQLGEDYRRYQRDVGAFIPRWKTFHGMWKGAVHA
jgi:protein-S-isoprenylcysteine O-methyltransferase Ste14